MDILFILFIFLTIFLLFLIFRSINTKNELKKYRIEKNIFTKVQANSGSASIIYTFGNTLKTKYISSNVYNLTGITQKSVISKNFSFHQLIVADDRDLLINTLSLLTIQKRNYLSQYRINTPEGKEKWILEQGYGIFDRTQQLIAVEAMLTDISESKELEVKLKESEDKIKILVENSPVAICLLINERISFCNNVFLRQFGYSESKEVSEQLIYEFIDKEYHSEFANALRALGREPMSQISIEVKGICSLGEAFFMQMYITSSQHNPDHGFIIFFIDITERKKNEEHLLDFNDRLGTIIDLIPDPTFVINNNSKVMHWNKAIEELTGVKKENIIGTDRYSQALYGTPRKLLIDLLSHEDACVEYEVNFYDKIKRLNGKVYAEFKGYLPSSSDEQTYLWGVAAPLIDKKGNQFGAIELVKDITELKKRERDLYESEERARVLINNNRDIIFLIYPDGKIIHCNFQLFTLLDKREEEIIGNYYQRLLPDSVTRVIESYITSVLETHKEIISQAISYKNIDYITSVYPVKDSKGKISRLVISAHDISDIRNAERELKEKEEQYRAIATVVTDYVFKVLYKDGHTSYNFDNPGLEKITGYNDRELRNVYHGSIREIIYPPDRAYIESSFYQLIGGKHLEPIEYRLVHKRGNIIWVKNTFVYTKGDLEKGIEILCVIKDITQQKILELAIQEAEERYRNVFEQSGLASNVFDLSGKLIMQNELAAKIFGKSNSESIGKSIDEIFDPADVDYIKLIFSETLKHGSFYDERKFMKPHHDYWIKIISQVIRNEKGDKDGIQVITQNITQRKEQERQIYKTMIETEEKERTYFSQEIHDSLGPLMSTLKMYIQWLGRPSVKIPREEILKDAEKLIDESIREIREISFKLSPHVLKNLGLFEALKTFSAKLNPAGSLNVEITGNFTTRMSMLKETILYRVLCECINNTIKYAEASQVSIDFFCEGNALKILYTDNGIGFNIEGVLNKSGTGILNIQNRLRTIDANYEMESYPGKGMKIRISLLI